MFDVIPVFRVVVNPRAGIEDRIQRVLDRRARHQAVHFKSALWQEGARRPDRDRPMNGEKAIFGAKLVLDPPSSAPCAIIAGNRERAIRQVSPEIFPKATASALLCG